MIAISFPTPEFRVREEDGKQFIFDSLRKKWLILTPEEWVRQNFVQYLIKQLAYPAALIAQEKEIQLGDLKKRFDILVYDRRHQPWMMIECKGGDIQLNSAVLEQLLRYNISVPVEYMVITNGKLTFGWQKAAQQLLLIEALPVMPEC